jgi:DNA-binding transcriptional LysR family regulator
LNSLADLQMFLSVASAENFSAAARQLGLPPSSVSRRIGAIEQRLGVALFRRTTRDVKLTDAGTAYSQSVGRILAELQAAEIAISRFAGQMPGMLKVEVWPGIGTWLLGPLLPRFLEENPEVQIQLEHRPAREPADALAEGADVIIRYGLAKPASLALRRLLTTRQGLYAAPRYLERHGTPAAPDALQAHNCLLLQPQAEPERWRFRRGDYDRSLQPAGTLRSNDPASLQEALAAGLGLAVLHEWAAAGPLRQGLIQRVLPDHEVTTMESFEMHISALHAAGPKAARKARPFLDFLATALGEANEPAA